MISLLCPTRGRPDSMRRFARSAWDTAAGAVEIVFYIDHDDKPSITAANELDVAPVVGPRIVLSECWNRCAEAAAGDILGHMGDDIIFRTPGWDQQVREAIESHGDRIAFVHGRDGIQDENLGTHGFVHRRWVDTLGYFVPPYFSSDYNDTWLTEVADKISRRVFLSQVLTEHLHPVAGKGEWDLTHQERLARGERDDVAALYARLAPERDADADKLRQVIACP